MGLGGAPLPESQAPAEKIIPEIIVSRVKLNQSSDGEHLDVWAFVKNLSTIEVEITEVECIKQHIKPSRFLKAGGSYELDIYSGPTPTNDAEVTATMTYKSVEPGDYFQAQYTIGYHCVQNGQGEHHLPQSLTLVRPIREINP